MLSQVVAPETATLNQLDLLQAKAIEVVERHSFGGLDVIEDAELHTRHELPPALQARAMDDRTLLAVPVPVKQATSR
jgi:hypothetical protein